MNICFWTTLEYQEYIVKVQYNPFDRNTFIPRVNGFNLLYSMYDYVILWSINLFILRWDIQSHEDYTCHKTQNLINVLNFTSITMYGYSPITQLNGYCKWGLLCMSELNCWCMMAHDHDHRIKIFAELLLTLSFHWYKLMYRRQRLLSCFGIKQHSRRLEYVNGSASILEFKWGINLLCIVIIIICHGFIAISIHKYSITLL